MVGASTAHSLRVLRCYSPVTSMLDRRYGSVLKPFEFFCFSVATMGIMAGMCFLVGAVIGPMVAIFCSMVVMVGPMVAIFCSMVVLVGPMVGVGLAVVGGWCDAG